MMKTYPAKALLAKILIIGLLLPSYTFSQTRELKLNPPGSTFELKRNQGIVLFELNVGGVAPAIDIVRLTGDEKKRYDPGLRATNRVYPLTVNLRDLGNGLYIAPLETGTYQITTIYAPYFDLPFRLDTEFDNRWRFHVAKNSTNYAGSLLIDPERSSSTVDVKLINRIAYNLENIESQLQYLIDSYPLQSGAAIRDDFFSELTNE